MTNVAVALQTVKRITVLRVLQYVKHKKVSLCTHFMLRVLCGATFSLILSSVSCSENSNLLSTLLPWFTESQFDDEGSLFSYRH